MQSLGDISGSGSGNGQKPAQKMEEAGGSRPTKAKEPTKTQVLNILTSRHPNSESQFKVPTYLFQQNNLINPLI